MFELAQNDCKFHLQFLPRHNKIQKAIFQIKRTEPNNLFSDKNLFYHVYFIFSKIIPVIFFSI